MALNNDPEFLLKLSMFRQKAASGTISLEEMREAVILMRQGRVSAAAATVTSRSKKSSNPAANGDSLLNELENL